MDMILIKLSTIVYKYNTQPNSTAAAKLFLNL